MARERSLLLSTERLPDTSQPEQEAHSSFEYEASRQTAYRTRQQAQSDDEVCRLLLAIGHFHAYHRGLTYEETRTAPPSLSLCSCRRPRKNQAPI
jgi:hypothetical protein